VAALFLGKADDELTARLERAIDPDGRITRGIDDLVSLGGRTVFVLGADGARIGQLRALGADVYELAEASGSAEVIVAWWPFGRAMSRASGGERWQDASLGDLPTRVAPSGHLLIVEDYGRDDISRLVADPEREERLVAWSRARGPFLGHGFRMRVLHCWWQFPDLDEARDVLEAAFGERGRAEAERLQRPRLAYKVAIYHRAAVGGGRA
jgi:hypothetical protein